METSKKKGKESLPIAATTDPKRIENSDEFDVFENVPVFVEHTRKITQQKRGDDGFIIVTPRELKFGKEELEKVIAKNNERIEKTNDYVPIVIGHTSQDKSITPPKIGFAGPFRLGYLNKDKDKYAILADFRIDKDKTHLLKQYPRRSAELWAEDDYSDMYLDPISLLGGETPFSDMGVLYSRDSDGVGVVRYEAVVPGAFNSFVPGPVSIEKGKKKEYSCDGKPEKYSMDSMETEDAQPSEANKQIADYVITALLETPEFKYVRSLMNGEQAAKDAAQLPVEGDGQSPEVGSPGGLPVGDEATTNDSLNEPAEDAAPVETGEEEEEPVQYSEDSEEAPVEDAEPATDETEYDETTGDTEGSGPTEDSYLDNGEGEESFGDSEYEDDSDEFGDYDDESLYGDSENETEDSGVSAELIQKLDEMQGKVDQLQKVVATLIGRSQKTEEAARYAKLEDLSKTRIFDMKEEQERCSVKNMSSDDFEKHCDLIKARYSKTPDSVGMPNLNRISYGAEWNPDAPGAVQYAREENDKIEAEVMRRSDAYVNEGKYVPHDKIRLEVIDQFHQTNQ